MAANRRQNIVLALAAVQLLAALFLLAVSADAGAGVYKCVDADGGISYGQTPCPDQVTTTVDTLASNAAREPLDCRFANRFALRVARSMKSGRSSPETYMAYGGVDAMSGAAVNIVSYVHSFQHSDDISADRIAALAGTRCKARTFGIVSCETLPVAFTDSIGGCGGDDNAEDGAENATTEPVASPNSPARANGSMPAASASAARTAALSEEDARSGCIEQRKTEMDRINDAMQRGYTSAQGEAHRARLRVLRQAINDC